MNNWRGRQLARFGGDDLWFNPPLAQFRTRPR
jgi:hypothetical protein